MVVLCFVGTVVVIWFFSFASSAGPLVKEGGATRVDPESTLALLVLTVAWQQLEGLLGRTALSRWLYGVQPAGVKGLSGWCV